MSDPLYRLIAEDLRAKIEAGELVPGTQMQTELELREFYNASRNTVRDAIKLLMTRGLVETRPGQGTFVAAKTDPIVTTLSGGAEDDGSSEADVYIPRAKDGNRRVEVTEPRVEIQRATDDLASQLAVAEGEAVISRHQQRYIDATPWSLQTCFYPMSYVNDGAFKLIETLNIEEGPVAYLSDAIGIKQVGWRDFIVARVPDRYETSFFGLPDNGQVPVFEIRRTGFDDAGRPIQLAITVYPADRNVFAYEEGTVPLPTEIEVPPRQSGESNASARESRDRTLARRVNDLDPYPKKRHPT